MRPDQGGDSLMEQFILTGELEAARGGGPAQQVLQVRSQPGFQPGGGTGQHAIVERINKTDPFAPQRGQDHDPVGAANEMQNGTGGHNLTLLLVGTARCAVRAASRGAGLAGLWGHSFHPLNAGGDIAARCPYLIFVPTCIRAGMLSRQSQRFEQTGRCFAEVHQRPEAAFLPFAGGNLPPPRRQTGKHRLNAGLQVRRNRFGGGAENNGPNGAAFLPQGAHQGHRVGPVVGRIMRLGTDENDHGTFRACLKNERRQGEKAPFSQAFVRCLKKTEPRYLDSCSKWSIQTHYCFGDLDSAVNSCCRIASFALTAWSWLKRLLAESQARLTKSRFWFGCSSASMIVLPKARSSRISLRCP